MRTFKLAFLLPLAFVAFACSQSPEMAPTSPSVGSTLVAGVSGPVGAQAGNTPLAGEPSRFKSQRAFTRSRYTNRGRSPKISIQRI